MKQKDSLETRVNNSEERLVNQNPSDEAKKAAEAAQKKVQELSEFYPQWK